MPTSSTIVAILMALLLTMSSAVAGFIIFPNGFLASLSPQGIIGDISIGPVSPICGVSAVHSPILGWYSQARIVVEPAMGVSFMVPLNWTLLYGCELSGTYRVGLNPGNYSLDLTICLYQSVRSSGCASLPKTVTVEPDSFVRIDISIRTGIQ